VADQQIVTEETLSTFHTCLRCYYDAIGLYFQKPFVTRDSQTGKNHLICDGIIDPPEGAIELLELLNPQLIDGRLEFDTSSDKLSAKLQFKTIFSKALRELPILHLTEPLLSNLPLLQDLVLKLKFATLADMLQTQFITEMVKDGSEEFKELLNHISVGKLDNLESILEKYYKDMMLSSKYRKPEPELWVFFKAYPLIVNNLETLKSITLIINNQVLTLDIDLPGLFTKLPKPTSQNVEDFNTLEVAPIFTEKKE